MVSARVKPIHTDVNMFCSRTKFVTPVESNILSQKSPTTGGEGKEGRGGGWAWRKGQGDAGLSSRVWRTGLLCSPGVSFCPQALSPFVFPAVQHCERNVVVTMGSPQQAVSSTEFF